jgi:hypothetical protein
MKYIITESQLRKSIDHLKEPMFRYWDINGPKDLKMARQLFNIPPPASTTVQEWLLEWMGGEDELYKMLKKYEGRDLRGQAGTYDFKFYVDNARIYVHEGVEIYFDATVDGNGKVNIEGPGFTIDTVYQAHMDEGFGWEIDDEIRDTIVETLEEITGIEFVINIDHIGVTEPGMYDND